MFIDKIILTPVPPHEYNVTGSLINSSANSTTKKLFDYLKFQYGKKILSGQTFYFDQLVAISGEEPKIRCWDMQNYSPHNPWGNGATEWKAWDDGSVQAAIDCITQLTVAG